MPSYSASPSWFSLILLTAFVVAMTTYLVGRYHWIYAVFMGIGYVWAVMDLKLIPRSAER